MHDALEAFEAFLDIPEAPNAEPAPFYDFGPDNLPPRIFLVATDHGVAPQAWATAYAWQGDNQLLHLYHEPIPLAELPDPMADIRLDESYVRLMQLAYGADWFVDL